MDHRGQDRQQGQNQGERKNHRNLRNAQREFDQEVGALGQQNQNQQQPRNYQNQYPDLDNDFEIGGITTDLDAGLDTDVEIGELGRNYEFPLDEQSQRRGQKRQRTQNQRK